MSIESETDTLLTVDVGSVNTRACLFDVVEGGYRLVAVGRAPSTVGPPLFDAREGVGMAVGQLQLITGRMLIDETNTLIKPIRLDGSGVDAFAVSTSAGPSLRTVLVGLMPGVSLDSARRLAASSYMKVVVEVSLLDRRREEERIDAILDSNPHLILIIGGTDGGANASVLRLVETVRLALGMMPEDRLPHIVYAGNQQLLSSVSEILHGFPSVSLMPNLRPTLEHEDLAPTRMRLAEVISDLRSQHVVGYEALKEWSEGSLMLSSDALSRVVSYLCEVHAHDKGVLGVDLGASHTTIAAALGGQTHLTVCNDLGLGVSLPGLLKHRSISDITRWLPFELPESVVMDYIFSKALHPRTIPTQLDELYIEFALARELVSTALSEARLTWPSTTSRGDTLMPPMEPIVAGGSVLSRAPSLGHAALTLLDAVQPVGVSKLVLDPSNLASALGVSASLIPMVTVQVLGSGSFINLGTVITPIGSGRSGRPMLRYILEREQKGVVLDGEIKWGQLAILPLNQSEVGRLTIRPSRGVDIGFGILGKGGRLRVVGGAVGLIIDGRGRPLRLPSDPVQRTEQIQGWLWNIGVRD
ncbi:MAG TPA: hypothetical protein G4O08_12800 [Anaerolineae bacterium]|nr:hypothetical protein [Anaerolineae bacterium]